MSTPEECVTVHLYRSETGEWGLIITDGHTAVHYWDVATGVPTQQARATALAELGYEVVSPWVWHEWPMQPGTHSLHATVHTRRIVLAVRECGCPSRFERHADGCTTLPASVTA